MIRVFIGTEPAQWLPTEVLKFSIRRRSESSYEFHDLKDIDLKLQQKMFTGFSFYRWYIPEACGFQGRAIYLDADMVVLADLKGMYELDMEGKGALARPCTDTTWYTSSMLLDCSNLQHWKIREWAKLVNAGIASYKDIMIGKIHGLNYKDFGPLPEEWNHLDHFDQTTKLIHYTTVPTQPWKKPGHKHAGVFLKEMKDALDAGVITKEQVEKEIAAGHIYPLIYENCLSVGAA